MKKCIFRCVCVSFMVAMAAPGLAFSEDFGGIETLKDFVSRDEVLTNLQEIDSKGYRAHRLPNQPWSDTYWPDRTGSIAAPYAQSGFVNLPVFWSMHRSFIMDTLRNLPNNMLKDKEIDVLSPAEKYDMLMGDDNFTLSNQVVKMIDELDDGKHTAMWSGVCHGWAPASLNFDRPLHAVTLQSPSGKNIRFFPSDIKALSSFLWAKSFAQDYVKFSGSKCKGTAETDAIGRITNKECFDVNPAFFHLVLVNQIGLNERGFIMDRSYEKRVMNQPVFAYEYEYYNPASNKSARSIEKATVILGGRKADPYSAYRSSRARKIVGVKLTVYYGKETQPNHDLTNSVNDDDSDKLELRYDLELDSNGDIVGGEWRKFTNVHRPNLADSVSYRHPDFIWATPPGLVAMSVGDFDIKSPWSGNGPVPQDWKDAAIKSALVTGTYYAENGTTKTVLRPQPLSFVVQQLIKKSRE